MEDIIQLRRKIREEKRLIAERSLHAPKRKVTQNSDTYSQNPLTFNRGLSTDSFDNSVYPHIPLRSDLRNQDSESGGFSPAYLLFERGESGGS